MDPLKMTLGEVTPEPVKTYISLNTDMGYQQTI